MADNEEQIESNTEAAKNFNDELERGKKLTDDQAVRLGELKTRLSEANGEVVRLNQQLEKGSGNLVEQLNIQEDLVVAKRRENDAQIAINALEIEQLDSLKELNKEQEDRLKLLEDENEQLIKQEEALRKQTRYYNNIDSTVENTLGKIGLRNEFENSFLNSAIQTLKTTDGTATSIQRMKTTFGALVRPQELSYAFIKFAALESIKLTKSLTNAGIELAKTTGFSKELRNDLSLARSEAIMFAGGIENAAKTISELQDLLPGFVLKNKEARIELEKFAFMMNSLGVSVEAQASAMLYFQKVAGISENESIDSIKSLSKFAQTIGESPGKMVEKFGQMIPKLSIFGDKAVDVFKNMSEMSKATGVSIERISQISEGFMNFEGAMKAVQGLNIALGDMSLLDPIELMRMEGAESIEYLTKAIIESGKAQEILSSPQDRMFITGILGAENFLEVQKLLNEELLKSGKNSQSFSDAIRESTTISDNLQAIFSQLAGDFSPLLDGVRDFLYYIAKSETAMLGMKTLIGIIGAAIAVVGVILGKTAVIISGIVIGLVAAISYVAQAFRMFSSGSFDISKVETPKITGGQVSAKVNVAPEIDSSSASIANRSRAMNPIERKNQEDMIASNKAIASKLDQLINKPNAPIQVETKLDSKVLTKAVFETARYS